jgi:hypothetical protein
MLYHYAPMGTTAGEAYMLTNDFPLEEWRDHARALVDEWLQDFAWRGDPLSTWIRTVSIRFGFGDKPHRLLWKSSSSAGACLVATYPADDLGQIEDAWYNMWHPVWPDLVSSWHLMGRWLHPETAFQVDQKLFADGYGSLLIGCLNREDLTAPRRFDPDLVPDMHDIGVIAFPLHPHQALIHRWAGYSPETTMLLCAGNAVAAAAVHEAFETFQRGPGQPVLDPHETPTVARVRVGWHANHTLQTDGWAIYPR